MPAKWSIKQKELAIEGSLQKLSVRTSTNIYRSLVTTPALNMNKKQLLILKVEILSTINVTELLLTSQNRGNIGTEIS